MLLCQKFYPEANDNLIASNFYITDEICNKISNLIKEENDNNWDHMIEKSKDFFLQNDNFTYYTNEENESDFIWYMWLTKVKDIYEAGSLIIDPRYQWKWYWKNIMNDLYLKYWEKPIFLVTNVNLVKNISSKFWLININKSDLPNELLEIIESEWKILDDDFVYLNTSLIDKYENN